MPGAGFSNRVIMDPVKLAEVLRGPRGPVVRDLLEAGELVKREARRLVGVSKPDPVPRTTAQRRPGTLRDSIVKRVKTGGGDDVILEVGSEDEIALWHHEGTRAHVIQARTKPRLVFYWPKVGRVVAFKRVNHPGTRPNRFLTNALKVLRGRYT